MNAFSRLTLRERVLLLGGGGLLLLIGIWLYVVQPLRVEKAQQTERIARYLSLLDIAGAAEALPVAAVRRDRDVSPLAPRITQSAEVAGIPIARLDPEGTRLRVTVAEAQFAELIAWISALETESGVRAVSLEMARLTEPGQVSMRITLEDLS